MRWRRIYLDYASGFAGNPSSAHADGRAARRRLEDARTRIARLVEAKPDDVIFTSGATEANALAILGVMRAAAKRRGELDAQHTSSGQPLRVLYLPGSHSSIVENVRAAAEETGARAEPLPLDGAQVDCTALARLLIAGSPTLVTMEAVCGETGVIWNTREVHHTLVAGTRMGIAPSLLHVDASQAPFVEKLSRAHFGADLLTLDGAKVGTEHRIGCLVAARTISIDPLYYGGSQERGLRPGTEDVRGAWEFSRNLSFAAAHREHFLQKATGLRARLIADIERMVPGVRITSGVFQAPHIVNLSLPGRDTDYLVALLDEAGFSVSTKSACETDSVEGSRAVFALFGDRDRALSTLRLSWGPHTNARELARFARALGDAVAFIDASALR